MLTLARMGEAAASVLGVRAGYEPQPMFDRRSRFVYAVLGVQLALGVVLYSILGLRFADISLALPSVTVGITLVAAWLARRVGFSSIAAWLETTTLIYLVGLAGWAVLFPGTALSLPFADPWLSAGDKALGFDFGALDRAVHGWPLYRIYFSFSWQAALIVPVLVFTKRDAWPLVYALTLAMVLTCLVYPFAPAMGPRVYNGLTAPDRQTLMIEALRDHHVRTITRGMLVGMVSFPSFHAAAAAIYAWAMWPVRFLRWPFVLLNVAVICTTMTEGDHYLVDVFGGLAVAWLAIAVTSRLYGRYGKVG